MLIAVIATTRNPLREPFDGGQEAQTAAVLRGLRRRGHRIRLYAVRGSDPELCDEFAAYPEPPPPSLLALADPGRPPSPEAVRDEAAMAWAMCHLVSNPVDVIHNQSLHHLPLAMSAALPSPMVTTLHTPPFPWMEMGVHLADPAVCFVGVSAATARVWSLPSTPRVILNGISSQRFPLGPGGDQLVWVGRITAEKGTHLAIAAARAAGRDLRVIGPVYDRDYYETSVRPLLGDGVVHHGHLDHTETARIVGSSAACLVTPRWEEPFGLVAGEAMMCGTPVIALARGGLREIVAPQAGVLVPDEGRTEEELAAALAEAVPAAVALDRAKVRAHATAALGEERMVAEYDALLAEVAAAGCDGLPEEG